MFVASLVFIIAVTGNFNVLVFVFVVALNTYKKKSSSIYFIVFYIFFDLVNTFSLL